MATPIPNPIRDGKAGAPARPIPNPKKPKNPQKRKPNIKPRSK